MSDSHHGCGCGHGHEPPRVDAPLWARYPEFSLSLLCGGLALAASAVGRHGVAAPLPQGIFLLSYLAGSWDLAKHTVPTLLRGKFDVEFLMIVAALGAACVGEWEEGALLLFLFSFGHSLEHLATARARQAISALSQLAPKTVLLSRQGQPQEFPVEEARVGDIAIVRPGDRLAIDGVILEGRSSLDESSLTGESLPVEKSPGDEVLAGTLNGDGSLQVKVTRLASESTMARMIELVEQAQSQRSPTQTFAESFERRFVPAVLILVLGAAVIPPMLGWLPFHQALMRALSTLVGASPCALALATPSAVLAGIAQAARNGVLIKGGAHLENLGQVRAIAFDKTGTLTSGQPQVTDMVCVEGAEGEQLALAAGLEIRSTHPLAQAVVRYVRERGVEPSVLGEVENFPGRGVQSSVDGNVFWIGNRKLAEERCGPLTGELAQPLEEWSSEGKTVMVLGSGARVRALLALRDELRAQAPATLEQLKQMGVTAVMLTGDQRRVAERVAAQVGLQQVHAELLPEHKLEAVEELCKSFGSVAMVGDGVNDAPALARATVGIAMGAGSSDVALETADVALMSSDLSRLPFALELSRAARRTIRQNLLISLGVIALLVPSTLLGIANMGVAVLFHEGSTLVVLANALRLLRFGGRSS